MANRTVKDANSIHGTNPQYLVEKIIRTRIYECKYWKEECFGLTAELVVDKAMELKYVGGVFGGNIKPTPFLCLALKLLQIQPEKDIIVEFIKNEDFKYVRLLGAMYMRLTGTAVDCYKYLEPLYNDYRKIKSQNREGEFHILHVDEFVHELLHSERVCDIILPRLQKRQVLEEAEMLEPRISALEEDLDEVDTSDEDDDDDDDEDNDHCNNNNNNNHHHHRRRDGDQRPERIPSPEPHRHRGNHRRSSPAPAAPPPASSSPPSSRHRRSRSPRRRSRSPKVRRSSPEPRRERRRSKSPRRHRERRHRSKSPPAAAHHRSGHRHRSHSKSPDKSSKKSRKKSRRSNQ
ncbi:pre-mRNA-splicing factor 38A [Stigmatopora nigra]